MAAASSPGVTAADIGRVAADPQAWRGPSLQLIYDTAPIGLAFLSTDCRYIHLNQRLTEICGLSVEAHLGRYVRDCVPALADAVEAIVRSVVETGEPVTGIEVAGQRPGVTDERSWVTYWHPVVGPDGAVVGVNVAAEEITERKRAEAATRTSEQQFQTLTDAIPQLVWMSDAKGRIFWFSHQLEAFSATPTAELRDQDWLAVLRPEAGHEAWARALEAGAAFEMELDLCGRTGPPRPFLSRIVPLRTPDGGLYRWIGAHIEISELREREAHIRFIADELSHRTKNLLAVVTGIARRTARGSDDVAQFLPSFSARLSALSQCHDLLVRDHWYGSPISDLVAAQLKPFGELNQGRIEAGGPPMVLRPNAVQHLGLAIHELATNAAKHGALSNETGLVSVGWDLDRPSQTAQVRWAERGGPLVAPPARRGFGHVVIDQIVPRALAGRGTVEYHPEGVRWTFEFPFDEEAPPDLFAAARLAGWKALRGS